MLKPNCSDVYCVMAAVVMTTGLLPMSSVTADEENPFATAQEKLSNAKPRTWNDRSGKFSVEATLVKIEPNQVVLRRADDKEISVPIGKLSDNDQSYLASLRDNASAATERTSAGELPSVFGKDLTATDYRRAKFVDFSEMIPWTYKPDSIQSRETLQAARVALKKIDDRIPPSQIMLLPREKRAYVVYYDPYESHASQVQACNLQSGQVEAAEVFAESELPVAISPDGKFVLSQPMSIGTGRQAELYLYTLEGQKVKPLKGWRPFIAPGSPGADFEAEVDWVAFADAHHVLTRSRFGKLIAWEVPSLKAIWAASVSFGCTPALSRGGKYVAVIAPRERMGFDFHPGERPAKKAASSMPVTSVSILNVADGTQAARIAVEDDPLMRSVALSDDGSRIALLQNGRLRIWNLESQELVRDFALKLATSNAVPGALAWISDEYLLLGNGVLIDVERRIPIWHYDTIRGARAICDGKVWFVDRPPGTGSCNLVGLALPHAEALASVAHVEAEKLQILHPGMEVAIDCQTGGNAEEIAAARKTLEQRLQNNGMRIARDGRTRLTATIQPGKATNIRYYLKGAAPQSAQLHRVSTEALSLCFEVDGNPLWQYESPIALPDLLQLEAGETVEQALQRVKSHKNAVVQQLSSVWIPTHIVLVANGNLPISAPQNGL